MSYELVDDVIKEGPPRTEERFVLAVLASFVNAKSGRCDPSVAAIAERACMTERGARGVIRRLEASGWLSVETGGGRAGCSTYRINTERASGFSAINPERGSAPPGTPCRETRKQTTENPEPNDTKPGTTFRRTQKNKEEQGRGGTQLACASDAPMEFLQDDASGTDDASGFIDALWAQWPKKSRRQDAEAAIRAALQRGVPKEMIARGAAAYVADRRSDSRGPSAVIQFTAPLGRWIEGEQWNSYLGLPEAKQRAAAAEIADHESTTRAAEDFKSRRSARIF